MRLVQTDHTQRNSTGIAIGDCVDVGDGGAPCVLARSKPALKSYLFPFGCVPQRPKSMTTELTSALRLNPPHTPLATEILHRCGLRVCASRIRRSQCRIDEDDGASGWRQGNHTAVD